MNTETKRQQKFARLVKEELSVVFQRDLQHCFDNAFITITAVRVTPDLSIARIYLSFLLAKSPTTLLEDIEDKNKLIRQSLSNRIGKSVRIIPELQFFLDDSADYAEKMDKIFENLNIPPVNE
ncbi:MAG: 30S ribosome-binding factor RbfA [Cytophagia bacterium]|nr:MAG: 30S ribosome-binding factor RbfA [Cytophagales bacterium]TAG06839.1 MAG: 30S ribosome-binding factor RbfA [Cytophagia bacterium]TAG43510.1 MAG: 30S ribosome-binding factor RbfA [Cytophagia bacterium]TAH30248.1 MAG: 30S ribosome-binding factor RbfA [Cytophagales bacterium]